MVHDVNTLIDNLPRTSSITIRRLKSIGIKTYWDLLNYFPFRWQDYSLISSINKLQAGETVTLIGEIVEARYQVATTGTRIQKFIIKDETAVAQLNWYNQPYLLKLLKPGTKIAVAGEIQRLGKRILMEPKEYEIINSNESIHRNLKHTGRIIPIYPEKRGLSSKTIREKIFYILNQNSEIPEYLPTEIVSYNNLINEMAAYQNIHFPENWQLAKKAQERLAFDEMFFIQLGVQLIKKQWEKEMVGNRFMVETSQIASLQNFINNLPFQLTNSQKKAWGEIIGDLQKIKPMNRLLQGDVGCGKTVVAALACYLTYLNGYQSLLMAPTEILAFQHYQTISSLFKNYPIKIALQTSTKKAILTKLKRPFQDNQSLFNIIIGTHALISKKFSLDNVGLVIIDEQHRFGVLQRAMLKEKGMNPHLLTMTATPIPRTVALTLYGELDLSIIDEMPKGRLTVRTFLVPREKREAGYQWIKEQIKKHGGQVFIICPLIEESEIETLKSVKAAKQEFERLSKEIFPEFRLGLLHGKIKSKEKDKIMNDFKNRNYDILVATPVVEVGIDVPNATIMLIEAAERFGLAQLHQLRGRVGRGQKQSYCFLFTEKEDQQIRKRLTFFAKTQNGITLAEYDLKHRGPGEIYGTKQHGMLNLKIARLSDYQLIEKTKKAVSYFIQRYAVDKFPQLKKRIEEYNIKQITRD